MLENRKALTSFYDTLAAPTSRKFYLTQTGASLDTALNAELNEVRNCGHGHVHAIGTRPSGSGAADALDATDLRAQRPGS